MSESTNNGCRNVYRMWSQLPDDVQLTIYSDWLTDEWLCLQLLLWMPPTLLSALERFSERAGGQRYAGTLRDWVLPLVAAFRDTKSPALRTLRRAHPRPSGFCCLEYAACDHRLPLCGLWCVEPHYGMRRRIEHTTLHSLLWFHFCDAAEIYPLHRSSLVMAALPDPPCPITWFEDEAEMLPIRPPVHCDTVILHGNDRAGGTFDWLVSAPCIFPRTRLPRVHTLSWECGEGVDRELRLWLLPELRSLRLEDVSMTIAWRPCQTLITLFLGRDVWIDHKGTMPSVRSLTMYAYCAELVRSAHARLESLTLCVHAFVNPEIIRSTEDLVFPAMRVLTLCGDRLGYVSPHVREWLVSRMPALKSVHQCTEAEVFD